MYLRKKVILECSKYGDDLAGCVLWERSLTISKLQPSFESKNPLRRFIYRMGSKYFVESVALCMFQDARLASDFVISLRCLFLGFDFVWVTIGKLTTLIHYLQTQFPLDQIR